MENTKQINKIKEKLILAKKKDKKRLVFGAKSHQYKAKNSLSIAEVSAFEKEYNIKLTRRMQSLYHTNRQRR